MPQLTPVGIDVAATIKRIALASLPPDLATKVNLSFSPQIFPAQHVFNLVDTKLVVRQDAALVFVDLKPQANWGHPCTYQFYDPHTGALLYSENALFPPNLAGDTPLQVFHQPVLMGVPTAHELSVVASLVEAVSPKYVLPLVSDAAQQRYAILWTSQISNLRHVEDLEFFWRALVNVYGFTASNIYVLCYNGTIGATDVTGAVGNWYGNNTAYQMKVSYSATTANLQTVFNTLAGKLKPKDLLFIHTNNHGSPSGCCVDNSTVITPTQFGTMLSGLPVFRDLIVTMEQCYSGAFQSPTLTKSTAVNTAFASAVDANTESDGAAHFDPWALALAEALVSTTPAGANLPTKPNPNFDGLVSIKAACDWAKANDTGKDDDPQYGDKPAGCGSWITLGVDPVLPDQDGDTNADGCTEIVVTSPWGIGVLEQVGNTMSGLVVQPNGTRFGGWLFNSADNLVGPLADYNGDGKAEIFISSPWGVGILQQSGSTFVELMMAPNGTRFGGWLLDTTQNTFGPAGDFDGDGHAEIFVWSPWGVGILKLVGGALTSLMLEPNGTRFGGWLLDTTQNSFGPAAKYLGNGRAQLLISSPWGVGILDYSGGTFTAPMMQPNGTRFGGWLLDTSNNHLGRAADYDGDGKAEILSQSPWGIGILKVVGNSMTSLMLQPNGTRFGGWLLDTFHNVFGFSADYDGDGKAEIFISSSWGVGILKLAGTTLSSPLMAANGTRFGGWLLNTADNKFGPAASYEGGPTSEILVTSPWGIGILRLVGNALTAPMMQPNGTRFGGWLLNTGDNQF
jgi:Peptidase C13 family/FG-GAP-like repeat